MKARRGSREWREAIAEGVRRAHASRRRRQRLALMEFERTGAVAPEIRSAALAAEAEAEACVAALGGPDRVTPQRMALVKDLARLGTIARVLFARMLRTGILEPEVVAKLSTLLGARRAGLAVLGLDRAEHDVLDVEGYLAQSYPAAPLDVGPGPDADLLD